MQRKTEEEKGRESEGGIICESLYKYVLIRDRVNELPT